MNSAIDPGAATHLVVAVIATFADGPDQFGTGYLIGDRLVLTAEHCTRDRVHDRPLLELRVVCAEKSDSTAKAEIVRTSGALDVAVLRLGDDVAWARGNPVPEYARVDRSRSGILHNCEGIGYPLRHRDPDKRQWNTAELHGTIYQTDGKESGRLLLHEPTISPGYVASADSSTAQAAIDGGQRRPSQWDGMSGTLIFYQGYALGVVIEHHERMGPNSVVLMAFDTIARRADEDENARVLATAIGLPKANSLPVVRPASKAEFSPAAQATTSGMPRQIRPARPPTSFMASLGEGQRSMLAGINKPGLTALRAYLSANEAIAVLGPGVSAPLYPGPSDAVKELINEVAPALTENERATYHRRANVRPETVVEMLRSYIDDARYWAFMDRMFAARADAATGRTWTPAQELVCRCDFRGIITVNCDPGLDHVRGRVRPDSPATGFTTWADEANQLAGWRTGKIFELELPVLYAHGFSANRESIVFAASDYSRAYSGRLSKVLGELVDTGHLVWIGFNGKGINATLEKIAERYGPLDRDNWPRHVMVMPWDPGGDGNDPSILAKEARITFGADLVLYPAVPGDRSALLTLLSELADPRFPAVPELPDRAPAGRGATRIPVAWEGMSGEVEAFKGRVEELKRLDRWAADSQVSLIEVTAMGGAGKTALVSHWLEQQGPAVRERAKGIFGWSFYTDPSPERWAAALVAWAAREFGLPAIEGSSPVSAVFSVMQREPVILVLDGLEAVQQATNQRSSDRFLSGSLREVLTLACQHRHFGLIVLTSRFGFADLAQFDGGRARVMELPPLLASDGADVLEAGGGDWLDLPERLDLTTMVDGHALSLQVLAAALARRSSPADLRTLREELADATRADTRLSRVLGFYDDQLSEQQRYLLAAVSLFAHPVTADAILDVAKHPGFGGILDDWRPADVNAAVRRGLEGLASIDQEGAISAHPLIRETFRPLALGAAKRAADLSLTGVPAGPITTAQDALVVVECIELLLDGGQWRDADELYRRRTQDGNAWRELPAPRLGQRAATAFTSRSDDGGLHLMPSRLSFYVTSVGLYAEMAGEPAIAREYLTASVRYHRDTNNLTDLARVLCYMAGCLGVLGEISAGTATAVEALQIATQRGADQEVINCHVYLGRLATLLGDVLAAEEHFIEADLIQATSTTGEEHLSSVPAVWWADFLLRTGRTSAARKLTENNLAMSSDRGDSRDVALCQWLLGRLELTDGNLARSDELFKEAADCFRHGEMLVELAAILSDQANCARATGSLDAADQYVTEALSIASPRNLAASQSTAQAVRAFIYADRYILSGDSRMLLLGEDAAQVAQRSARGGELAWEELAALQVLAILDELKQEDYGRTSSAERLRRRLMPDLDPDPVQKVRRLLAARGQAS